MNLNYFILTSLNYKFCPKFVGYSIGTLVCINLSNLGLSKVFSYLSA